MDTMRHRRNGRVVALALLATTAMLLQFAGTALAKRPSVKSAAQAKHIALDAMLKNNPVMNFEKLLFVKRFKYQSNHYYWT